MSNDPESLLIIARSGRALAQSARRGGWDVRVIDAFADCDTRACARDFRQIAMDGEGLHAPQLLSALTALNLAAPAVGLIYGAGLESMPDLLERIEADYKIIGNGADILRAVKDPSTFFAALDALKIGYPETPGASARPTQEHEGWLVKRIGGAGGAHVRSWDGTPVVGAEFYLQRHVAGAVMSVLFAADGFRARIIGFNTQWTAELASQPFAYGGAINRATLTPRQRQTVADHAQALTGTFGLRGINSLDFVVSGDRPLVLEINPRPTATCELYETDTRDSMIALHVRACGGELPARAGSVSGVRVHAVAYAPFSCRIPVGVRWPRWCRDLPLAGVCIAPDKPLCSVYAEGNNVAHVRRLINMRRQSVLSGFRPRSMAA